MVEFFVIWMDFVMVCCLVDVVLLVMIVLEVIVMVLMFNFGFWFFFENLMLMDFFGFLFGWSFVIREKVILL